MSELATAPSPGDSAPAPASTSGAAPAASTPEAKGADAKAAPSAREAIDKAMSFVDTRPPTETEKAAAVLREGAGADDKLVKDQQDRAAAAQDEASRNQDASERAKKGWETRRANQEALDKDAQTTATVEAAATKAAETVVAKTKSETPPVETKPVGESKFKEAPTRFVPEAKAKWEAVPEEVRSEIDRTIRNLEQGHAKFKADADKFASVAEYAKLSEDHYKQPLADTLKNYVALDRMLQSDPLAGLERIVDSLNLESEGRKLTLRDVAAHIMNQPEGSTFRSENVELKNRLEAAEKRISDFEKGFVSTRETEQKSRLDSINKQTEDFAKSKPRWPELEAHVLKALKSEFIERTGDPLRDLQQAYEFVERLNPAPALSPPAPEIPASDSEAQRRKGSASVSGAPGNGSSPATRKPAPTSAGEAARMALSRMGFATT